MPEVIAGNALLAAKLLGTVAMAALGLLVDPMAIRRVSARVSVALVGAFGFLLALSLSAIFLFGLGGGFRDLEIRIIEHDGCVLATHFELDARVGR